MTAPRHAAALPRPPEVARVLRTATETARRHGMLPPGSTVLAAVSGGPDSICLLHTLVLLRRLLRIEVACGHVDHGLRPASAADAAYVRRQAERLGVPFLSRAVAARPPRGASVEAWARAERYRLLDEMAAEVGAARIAVGHTRDDRAETVLLALIRGGGIEALTGMRPVRDHVVRPLLDVPRDQVEAFCRALSLRPRRDATNEDPAYLRSAIRGRVLPAIERATGREVRATLARTAALLAEDADLLAATAEAAATEVLWRDGEDVVLGAAALAALPAPVAGRIAVRAIREAGADPTARGADRVRSLASARPGTSVSVAPGLRGLRGRAEVRLSRAARVPLD